MNKKLRKLFVLSTFFNFKKKKKNSIKAIKISLSINLSLNIYFSLPLPIYSHRPKDLKNELSTIKLKYFFKEQYFQILKLKQLNTCLDSWMKTHLPSHSRYQNSIKPKTNNFDLNPHLLSPLSIFFSHIFPSSIQKDSKSQYCTIKAIFFKY